MRGVGLETPVLVMSAMSDIEHRVEGLRAGADDYLSTRFSTEEMSARVEALLRRRPRGVKVETVLRNGELVGKLTRL
jgi:two-component system, OmpR family, response regulator